MKFSVLLPLPFLALLTTLAYKASFVYPFLFDDLPNITNSFLIRQWHPQKMFFSSTRWISRLINQWTYHNWEFNPAAYRIIDLVIHLTAGILVFFLVLVLCKNAREKTFIQRRASLLATLTSGLFLLHPVQSQTVSYVTQIRLEGLVAVFTFSVLLTFAMARLRSKTTPWQGLLLYSLTSVLILFAAGTKEIIIVLPALLILTDWFFLAKGNLRVFFRRLPLHLLFAVLLYGTFYWLGGPPVKTSDAITLQTTLPNNRGNILTPEVGQKITPIGYLMSQFRVIVHYFSMFFLPLGITFDYGWKIPASFWRLEVILPLLLLIALALSAAFAFWKKPTNIFTFAIAWFFVCVLPRSTIIPSTELVCDYKTYLASFGVLFLIAYLLVLMMEVISGVRSRTGTNASLTSLIPLALLIPLAFATNNRNTVWSSRTAFWQDVIDKTKGHTPARAWNNYAVGFADIGQHAKAVPFYKNAIETDPTYAEPQINLAMFYQAKKQYAKALDHYKIALGLKEPHPEMYNNLGLLHFDLKTYDKAEACFRGALKLKPYYSKALFNMGRTFQMQGKLAQAQEAYEKAVKGNFQNRDFFYAHAALSYQLKKYASAIFSFEQLQKISPNFKGSELALANCYYYTGNYDAASKYFKKAFVREPNSISIAYNLGQSLLQIGQHQDALARFQQCVSAEKQYPYARLHVAKCLHKTGDVIEAKKELVQFLKTAPTKQLHSMGKALEKEIG